MTDTASLITMRSNITDGSATCAAVMRGSRVAAKDAAAHPLAALTASIMASQGVVFAARRATRVPMADPTASPATNAAAIVAKAYVVGPRIMASRRVHATS